MMGTEIETNLVKMKSNQDGSSSSSKGKSIMPKSETKEKATTSSSKTTSITATVKVKQKKVFSLPGQRYDPPEEREPLRIFYESLSKQVPTSDMAEFWMMEHGLLSPERAKRAYERKQKRQQKLRIGTPIQAESSQAQQGNNLHSKKRIRT